MQTLGTIVPRVLSGLAVIGGGFEREIQIPRLAVILGTARIIHSGGLSSVAPINSPTQGGRRSKRLSSTLTSIYSRHGSQNWRRPHEWRKHFS